MAIVNPTAPGTIAVTAGTHETLIILSVLTIVVAMAAYFTGRLYGKMGIITIGAGYVVVVGVLALLGGCVSADRGQKRWNFRHGAGGRHAGAAFLLSLGVLVAGSRAAAIQLPAKTRETIMVKGRKEPL